MPEITEKDINNKTKEIFSEDTQVLAESVEKFIHNFFPAYTVPEIKEENLEKSWQYLRDFEFYRIVDCTINKTDDVFNYFAEKMQKFFITAYAIKSTVCYGIISIKGQTSLVIGLQNKDKKISSSIIEGLFPGINLKLLKDFDLVKYNPKKNNEDYEEDRYLGCICGVPALKENGEYIHKDLASLTRSLNGQNYTFLVICKPLSNYSIQQKINIATEIRDASFAISKRTLSSSFGNTVGNTHTDTHSESDAESESSNKQIGANGVLPAVGLGAGIGAIVGGGLPGAIVGGAGAGLLAMISGVNFSSSKGESHSHTVSTSYSDAVSESINRNKSISGDIQNGYALELIKMCDNILERCKIGRNIGMWETVVSYSSESEIARDIIQGCVYSEMASSVPEILPPKTFSYKDSFFKNGIKDYEKEHNQNILLPKGFSEESRNNDFISFVTSEELCGICTIPTETTIGFSIYQSKDYSLNCYNEDNSYFLGKVCEYNKPIENSLFGVSKEDLNKHTFVCGITGSGKTNTVKKILNSVNDVPFLVLEPAKKEYRNLENVKTENVYSLGRTELNCLRINPFYILPGVSPQHHIDLLKDLFSASFAFYGPMPYIMEKCLNNIYVKKGWNLTLGFHPYLINEKSKEDFFNNDVLKERYNNFSHQYLFPTMKDLKDEIDRYVEDELSYEGEVKGNIRGALQARIDSLCIGSKGYMFNTYEKFNVKKLLTENSVIELEGLADDSDKAFALGLIIIFINEFREIEKEIDNKDELKHLLVIEEAHRLLTNVSTSKNEDIGNPKGKAVEHFTNLLAEMRSYGQGVIIAEQIPTKLAPEVIKNTSNKIIHRLVSKDDQEIIANCVGIELENAIYLGGLKKGIAICHKEGMFQPVVVKIDEITDTAVKKDVKLYSEDLETRMQLLTKSIINNNYTDKLNLFAIKILVSILYGIDVDIISNKILEIIDEIRHDLKIDNVSIPPIKLEIPTIIREILYEDLLSLLTRGVFSFKELPGKEINELLQRIIVTGPTSDNLKTFNKLLEKMYHKKTTKVAVQIVACLLSDTYEKGTYMSDKCNAYLLVDNINFCSEVVNLLKGGSC